MRLIVDADPLVYRAGFGAEQKHYHGVVEHPDGTLTEFYKRAGQDMREYEDQLALLPGGCHRMVHKEAMVTAEPVHHALHLVKHQIEGMVGALQLRKTPPNRISVVLTGPGNFREKLATVRPYKGNRDPDHVPVHYNAIRNYLVEHWSARVIHGREADDEVAIMATESRAEGTEFCIATIDKDLDQVPGLHYDYRLHVFYDVSEADGRLALWTQILAGDHGDNVPGCPRYGVKRAQRFIAGLIAMGWDDTEIWDAVVAQYRKADIENAEAVALETARLVYILRRPGEVWYPDGPRIEKGEWDD